MSTVGRRQHVALAGPPEDPARLVSFPLATLREGLRVARVTRRGRGPWWFSSRGAGRFDLPLPEGTCYLAIDEISALLEVLGGGLAMMICTELLEAREIHRLVMPQTMELADLADRGARRFGITGEIHTLVPYELPQRWALALRAAGHDGVRYKVRHDPDLGTGIALFGAAGEKTSWPRGETVPCDDPAVIRRLFETCGIRVVPRPNLDQLLVDD